MCFPANQASAATKVCLSDLVKIVAEESASRAPELVGLKRRRRIAEAEASLVSLVWEFLVQGVKQGQSSRHWQENLWWEIWSARVLPVLLPVLVDLS